MLLGGLGSHEPHVGPGHCLTDCLGISGIILVPLHVWPDIGWRHQAHGMPKGLEFARPMMRRSAGLDPHKTPRQLLEESNDVPTLQLAPEHPISIPVQAMNLNNRLCDVETDRRHSLHRPFLRIRSPSATMAPTCRWRSRPQHHKRTSANFPKADALSIAGDVNLA